MWRVGGAPDCGTLGGVLAPCPCFFWGLHGFVGAGTFSGAVLSLEYGASAWHKPLVTLEFCDSLSLCLVFGLVRRLEETAGTQVAGILSGWRQTLGLPATGTWVPLSSAGHGRALVWCLYTRVHMDRHTNSHVHLQTQSCTQASCTRPHACPLSHTNTPACTPTGRAGAHRTSALCVSIIMFLCDGMCVGPSCP